MVVIDRPAGAFELFHRLIAVEQHQQVIAFLLASAEILNVTGVQNIEATVGQADTSKLSVLPPLAGTDTSREVFFFTGRFPESPGFVKIPNVRFNRAPRFIDTDLAQGTHDGSRKLIGSPVFFYENLLLSIHGCDCLHFRVAVNLFPTGSNSLTQSFF
jgi:hypothetical protein